MSFDAPARGWPIRAWVPRILLAMLCVYWTTLFIGTHLPRVPRALAEHGDKLLHVGAYAGLATLLMSWRYSRGTVTRWRVLWDGLLIVAFAAFDEITQPLVGRFCELADWIADVAGVMLGFAITALVVTCVWPWLARQLQRNTDGAR